MTDKLMEILNKVSFECYLYMSKESYYNARDEQIHKWRNLYNQITPVVLENWEENCWKTFVYYQNYKKEGKNGF